MQQRDPSNRENDINSLRGAQTNRDENTRLFDIRTLADRTKQRVTGQVEAAPTAEGTSSGVEASSIDDLLRSSSSSLASLSLVSLPSFDEINAAPLSLQPESSHSVRPTVETPAQMPAATPVARDTTPDMAVPAVSASHHVPSFGASITERKPFPTTLVAGLLVVGAIAAAAAFFLMKGGAAQEPVVTPAPAVAAIPAPEPAQAPVVEPMAQPADEAQAAAEGEPGVATDEAAPGGADGADEAALAAAAVADDSSDDETETETNTETNTETDEIATEVEPEAATKSKSSESREERRARRQARAEAKAAKKAERAAAREAKKAASKSKASSGTGFVDLDKELGKALPTGKKTSKGKSSGDDSIDALLDQATGGETIKLKKEKKVEKKPDLPDLTKSEVKAGIAPAKRKAAGCANLYDASGTVKVRFTISPAGHVSKARATGTWKGTDVGKCMASAVKKLKFRKFSGTSKTVTYPFLLSN